MRTWVLHELMASTLFLLLLVSPLYILFQKREQPERAPVFFFLCFQSFPIRARRWKQLPPGRYWIEVWAAGRALKQRNAARSDHVHRSDVPYLHPLTLSGCKAKSRAPPARDSSLVTWLFAPNRLGADGESAEDFIMRRERERERRWAICKRRNGHNEAWSVTRKRHRPVFAFSLPSYLSVLLVIIRKWRKQWEGRKVESGPTTQDSRKGKRRAYYYYGQGKKWLKGLRWEQSAAFGGKREGISRADNQSITWVPVFQAGPPWPRC